MDIICRHWWQGLYGAFAKVPMNLHLIHGKLGWKNKCYGRRTRQGYKETSRTVVQNTSIFYSLHSVVGNAFSCRKVSRVATTMPFPVMKRKYLKYFTTQPLVITTIAHPTAVEGHCPPMKTTFPVSRQ